MDKIENKKMMKTLIFLNLLLLGMCTSFLFLAFQRPSLEGLLSGDKLFLRQKENASFIRMEFVNGDPVLSLSDNKGVSRLELHGGKMPSIFLKNDKNKTIGSWTSLADGGSGIGLASAFAKPSTVLKGGANPSLAFFSNQELPSAAFGIKDQVPHLQISGDLGQESVLIHGGKASGVMLVDEGGNLKFYLSKYGVFQEQEEEMPSENLHKGEKFFSFEEDRPRLFPDHESSKYR